MRIRNHLLAVVLAGLLPLVLFASVVGYLLVRDERATFQLGVEERARAMLTAVDTELRGSLDAIAILGQSASLVRGDLGQFRATAQRVLATQEDWRTINIALPSGERILDLLVPEGGNLPPITRDEDSFERVVQTRAPAIAQIALGPTSQRWDYAVRVPIMEQGSIKYVLTAVIGTGAMAELVLEQNLPDGWIGIVLDANDRVVARSFAPVAGEGQLAPASLRDAIARAPSGWFRTVMDDGSTEIYAAYRKSNTSGWTMVLGLPASAVDATATGAYALFAAGLLFALALAFAFARVVGRRIAAPIDTLATLTDGVRRGEPVSMPPQFAVAELEAFARTLAETLDALREREERLQLAIEAVRMGIWEWHLGTNQITWSEEMDAIHGFAPGDYSARESGTYEQHVHPEDRAAVLEAIARSRKEGEHQVEYRIIRPDGTVRWLEGRGKLFHDDHGIPTRMIGVCTDITERKEAGQALRDSEMRFRNMADTAPAILWITGPDARLTFISRGWYEFTGQTEQQAFGNDGFGWLDAVHPDDVERSAQSFRTANAARTELALDYRLRRADGVYRWAIDAAKPRFDANGGFLGFVGSVIDIDDRKRAEQELRASEQALRTADRHKDEFLATLSHELRNPLSALTTAAHVLRTSAPDDARTAAVHGVIDRQTQHMARLIEDLLDMTRIRLAKVSLHKAPMDLAALVAEVTQTRCTADMHAERAEVSVDATPVWIHADAARMEQVYANLLDNALKFTPPGGAIRVSVRQQGSRAVLVVSDNGPGIDAETLPRVFELFVQGSDAPRRTQGGLGLGLALVRQMVELHGGTVLAESAGEGKGATFTVSLPAIAAPGAQELPAQARAAVPPGRLRVLLVEDNADVRQMTRAMFELAGHDVREVDNGTQALELAVSFAPELVLLDIGLPDIDGYEVARRLRAATHDARLILIALSGHGEDYERARAAGFDAHMIKPADAERLFAVLAELIRPERGPTS